MKRKNHKYQLKVKVKNTGKEYKGDLFDSSIEIQKVADYLNTNRPMIKAKVIKIKDYE